jgi:hypothetical protein
MGAVLRSSMPWFRPETSGNIGEGIRDSLQGSRGHPGQPLGGRPTPLWNLPRAPAAAVKDPLRRPPAAPDCCLLQRSAPAPYRHLGSARTRRFIGQANLTFGSRLQRARPVDLLATSSPMFSPL